MNFYIFGLGAIGSNLLLRLAQQYLEAQFFGFDFDKVEERNIKTQAYFIQHIGQYKTVAMQSVLSTKMKKFNYKYETGKIENNKFWLTLSELIQGEENSIAIDCFDNIESRKLLHEKLKRSCLHVGFSPEFTAEITWGNNYKIPGGMNPNSPDICTLEKAGAFINFAVNLSALAIDSFIEKRIQRNFIVNGFNIIKN
jgi:hypothetical protein